MAPSRIVKRHLNLRGGVLFACFLFSLSNSSQLQAATSTDNNPAGGLNVQVDLVHRVVIPKILYFRLGSGNAVDRVVFDLEASPVFTTGTNSHPSTNIPLGDSNPIQATSNGVLDVDIRSNVGTVNISYTVDSATGLTDGAGNNIPYSQIETQATNANLQAPALTNAGATPGSANSVDVFGNLHGGRVVDLQGTWVYVYLNELTPVAGQYDGGVTYTASAP